MDDGNLPGTLDELKARHPAVTTCCVEGTWHAWIPGDANAYAGTEAHGRDEGELLAKLAAGLG